MFALLGWGLSNRQIAMRLDITERTVRAHTSAVAQKLQLGSRLHVCLVALMNRLHTDAQGVSPATGRYDSVGIDDVGEPDLTAACGARGESAHTTTRRSSR